MIQPNNVVINPITNASINNLYKYIIYNKYIKINNMQSPTPLSNAFFSEVNVNSLQEQIRYSVWKKSNEEHIIGKQDPTQLKLIMRSIFLQNSKNLPTNLLDQVKNLNKDVINYCVEKILVQINQKINYLRDIEQGPQPMERSINVSIKGDKSLENNIGFNSSDTPIGRFL